MTTEPVTTAEAMATIEAWLKREHPEHNPDDETCRYQDAHALLARWREQEAERRGTPLVDFVSAAPPLVADPKPVCGTCGGDGYIDFVPHGMSDADGNDRPCPECKPVCGTCKGDPHYACSAFADCASKYGLVPCRADAHPCLECSDG